MRDVKKMIDRIERLKSERNAVILAHNYELGEIQDIADFSGDSLELSMKTGDLAADVIVFCGVKFMAETASIISPEKTILLPAEDAGCLMADMATGERVRAMKAHYDEKNLVTVCYVNTTADVKAECDLCVTSSNALKVVSSIPKDKTILFLPDQNLGKYIEKETGRKMVLWEGYCPVHQRIETNAILRKKREFPNAEVLIHPESNPEAIELADKALSTGQMCAYAKESECDTFIVATESGIIHRLQKESPDKTFIPVSEQAICPDMKKIRLEDVAESLEKMRYVVKVPDEIAAKAKIPIERMFELSK